MASVKELMSTLRGMRVDSWVTDAWHQGGSRLYGHMDHAENGAWIVPDYTSGSDYSGSLVERSNFNVLRDAAEEAHAELCRAALENKTPEPLAFYVELHGGYSTFALAFHIERTPDDIAEQLIALDAYPLADENAHSQLEMEAQNEAWDDWAKSDYRRAVEVHYKGSAESVTDSDLAAHFYDAADKANEYWVNEEGPSMWIDIGRVVSKGAAKLPPPPGFIVESEG